MRTLPSILGVATLSAALLPQIVRAQAFFPLDEIVISPNYLPVGTDRTGASVSVIDEAEIEKTEEPRAIDLLAREPGVAIRPNGPAGTQARIFIRGVPGNNIGVLVDGIDVTDPSGPQVAYDFGGLLTSDLSRIEVLRGSQSATYGSRATGGVISLSSRRATEPGNGLRFGLEGGSYNTRRASLGLTAAGAGYDLALTVSTLTSDGYSAADRADGNDEADGIDSQRLSLVGGVDLGEAARLEFSAFRQTQTFDYDEEAAGLPFDGTPDDRTDKTESGARLALSFDTGAFTHTLSFSRFEVQRTNTGTNGFGPFEFAFEGTRQTLGYRATTAIGAGQLTFGLERTSEVYADASVYGSQRRSSATDSAYAEAQLAFGPDLDVTATLRHDDHSEFGAYTTGRFAAVWRLRADLLLRGSIGTGFRAPSNYELYDTFAGNAGLAPETSTSADLGIERRFGSAGRISATLFRIETEDLIDYSYTTFAYVQRDGTTTRSGIEIAGDWRFANGMALGGAYTYLHAASEATLDSSGWTAAAPRHTLALTFDAPIADRLDGTLALLHEADRPGVDDYTVATGALTWRVTDRTEAYLRVENLADAQYQVVPGYGTSRRAVFAGLRARF